MLPFAFCIIKTDRARHGFPPTFFAQVHTEGVRPQFYDSLKKQMDIIPIF
jgi:hypothetical protein